MKIKVIPVAPLEANCIILHNSKDEAIIIDPGGEPEKIIKYIEDNSLSLRYIFCTHGHFDHVGGIEEIKSRYNIPVYIHEDDAPMLAQAPSSAIYFGLEPMQAPSATDHFSGDEIFEFEDTSIHVIHTPGHSQGCVCFHLPEMNVLIAGDTLFQDAIGRSDLPGGNHNTLINSIQKKLYVLDKNTVVYCGHGPDTTIGYEMKNNPYVRASGI